MWRSRRALLVEPGDKLNSHQCQSKEEWNIFSTDKSPQCASLLFFQWSNTLQVWCSSIYTTLFVWSWVVTAHHIFATSPIWFQSGSFVSCCGDGPTISFAGFASSFALPQDMICQKNLIIGCLECFDWCCPFCGEVIFAITVGKIIQKHKS